jgi:phosphoglycerol transferase MdoB-like AlkP superfamily enzyme
MFDKITSNQTWLFANIFKLLSLFFLLFLLARVALLFAYPDDFQNLSIEQIFHAFLQGAIHFDTSILFLLIGIPIILTLLPLRWSTSRVWHWLVGWYGFLVFTASLFILVGDLIYFGQVHRHAGHELGAAIHTDPQLLLSIAIEAYWMYLILFVVLFLGVFKLWRMGMKGLYIDPYFERPSFKVRMPLIIIILALMILGIRGSITSKPIKPVYAFENVSMAEGHLALNGVFTTFHALNSEPREDTNFFLWDDAVETVRQIIASKHESSPDIVYPLMRDRQSPTPQKKAPNIVILLLESWDFEHLDATREQAGLKPFDVTPNFNQPVKEGLLFTRFYANGQRSIDAIAAILTGIPAIPGSGYLGEGVESNHFAWLGQMAKARGYNTYMLQGSRRASFYLDKIAPLAGFDTYRGAQDFSPSFHKDSKQPAWGGWDYDVLMNAHEQFASSDKPFAGFVFTVSTHTPFGVPGSQWQPYPEKTPKEKYLNSLFYADWALGEFFNKAKTSGYYDNTIFILTADHVTGLGKNVDILAQHHIPALIIAPGLTAGVNTQVGSQVDMIPTIIDLAGWQARHASLGTSLVEDHPERSAFIRRNSIIGNIEGDGVLLHNYKKRVHFEGKAESAESMQKRLLSTIQVLDTVLNNNKVITPSK